MLDLVIKNGNIIDGKRSKPFTSDIGIKNDKIYLLGKKPRRKKINQSGRSDGLPRLY